MVPKRSRAECWDIRTERSLLAERRHWVPVWGCGLPTYFLLDRDQVSALRLLGMRSFPPTLVEPGLTAYYLRSDRVLRKDAREICDRTIARVVLDHEFMSRKVLRHGDATQSEIVEFTIDVSELANLNNALKSRIELWTEAGWE